MCSSDLASSAPPSWSPFKGQHVAAASSTRRRHSASSARSSAAIVSLASRRSDSRWGRFGGNQGRVMEDPAGSGGVLSPTSLFRCRRGASSCGGALQLLFREVRVVPRFERVRIMLDLIFCGSARFPSGNKIQVRSSGSLGRTGPFASIGLRLKLKFKIEI